MNDNFSKIRKFLNVLNFNGKWYLLFSLFSVIIITCAYLNYSAALNMYQLLFLIFYRILICAVLLSVAKFDIMYRLIKNKVILLMAVAAVIYHFICYLFIKDVYLGLINILCGIALGLIPLLAIELAGRFIIHKSSIGGGDIKLMALCGLLLGMDGVAGTYLTVSILIITVVPTLILLKKVTLKDYIAFGPFISFGAITYMNLMM